MEDKQKTNLFLIPNILSQENTADFFSDNIRKTVHHVKQFVVENEKAARALINKLKIATPQNELDILLWNEHSKKEEIIEISAMFSKGDVGIISEAGIPCVADPGSEIVAWAHRNKIRVVPLPGASSLLMALMGSGFNGQSFVFHGYLPIDKAQRVHKLREICNASNKLKQSQIFIEAPYRNNHMLDDILKNCDKKLKLCIACDLTSANELMETKTVEEWTKAKPDLHKRPAIFIFG